ncbi:unnamed protein product, partial [Rotaria socialis]
TLPSETNETEQ